MSQSAALRHLISAAPATLAAALKNPEPVPSFDSEDNIFRFVAEQVSFPAAPHTQRYLRRHAEQLLQEAATVATDSPAAESKEQEAARLFLIYQALTFQHQFLHQYSKRLGKLALKKQSKRGGGNAVTSSDEDSMEERLADKQRLRMIFRGEKKEECLSSLVCGLPPTWTIVQISCVEQLTASRFKDTEKDEASRTANPALCVIRVR
jgi:hypothetical protein